MDVAATWLFGIDGIGCWASFEQPAKLTRQRHTAGSAFVDMVSAVAPSSGLVLIVSGGVLVRWASAAAAVLCSCAMSHVPSVLWGRGVWKRSASWIDTCSGVSFLSCMPSTEIIRCMLRRRLAAGSLASYSSALLSCTGVTVPHVACKGGCSFFSSAMDKQRVRRMATFPMALHIAAQLASLIADAL